MTDKIFNMLVRVVLSRVRAGENIDEVINSYNISDSDKAKLKTVVLALR